MAHLTQEKRNLDRAGQDQDGVTADTGQPDSLSTHGTLDQTLASAHLPEDKTVPYSASGDPLANTTKAHLAKQNTTHGLKCKAEHKNIRT